MNKLNLSKEQLLEKRQLAEICGGLTGGVICTCWNEDGTQTILEEEGEDAYDCAVKCKKYWEEAHNPGRI